MRINENPLPLLESSVDLAEYECTRIQGYLYFFNFPEEVFEEVISAYNRECVWYSNAEIEVANGSYTYTWNVDTDAKVIKHPAGSRGNYFA